MHIFDRTYRVIFALVCLTLAAVLLPAPVMAQGGPNLLNNPGFEGAYQSYHFDPTPEGLVPEFRIAEGWHPWFRQQTATDPGWRNRRPEYRPASYSYNGTAAQQFFTSFGTHQAGLWQRVENATPGQVHRFSVAIYMWSSMGDDVFSSTTPGGMSVRVGIDPAGQTNPYGESVVWSDFATNYDAWGTISVDAVAQSNALTVFVWSQQEHPVVHNDVALDEAYLGLTGADPETIGVTTGDTVTEETSPEAETQAEAEPATADDTPAVEEVAPVSTTPTLIADIPLRLRARPAARAIDVVPADTTVSVLGRSADRNWALVEYDGQQGWVASWLAIFSVDFDELPVVP